MKKTTTCLMIAVMALMLLSGIVGAQSTYLTDPSPPDPSIPGVPDDPTRIQMLDLNELSLTIGGASATLNATIPSEFEPYDVSWLSDDTDVATVTTQSAATVSPVAEGSARVYVFVTAADGEEYYDFAAVTVLAEGEEPAPTPPTSGGTTYTSIFTGLFLISAALLVKRKLLLDN